MTETLDRRPSCTAISSSTSDSDGTPELDLASLSTIEAHATRIW